MWQSDSVKRQIAEAVFAEQFPDVDVGKLTKTDGDVYKQWKNIEHATRNMPKFLSKHGDYVDATSDSYGVPTDVLVGIAFKESAGGVLTGARFEQKKYDWLLENKNQNDFLKNLTNDQIKAYASSYGVGQVGAWELAKYNSLHGSGLTLDDITATDPVKQWNVLGSFFAAKDSVKAPILSAATSHNWNDIAKYYNGPAWKTNNYANYINNYAKIYSSWMGNR